MNRLELIRLIKKIDDQYTYHFCEEIAQDNIGAAYKLIQEIKKDLEQLLYDF